MIPRYNLLDEPWLPVRLTDGTVHALGLLETFRRSEEISSLAETSPPSLVAEYRLLLAIVHRALTNMSGSWSDAQRAAWYRHGLPVDELCSYLESWRSRFWLFHAEHPFLQVAALAAAEETRDKRKPWTKISLASANGNTPVVFDHSVDTVPVAIEPALALGHLLGYLQFTAGGLVQALKVSDKAGALVNTAAVLPMGETLSRTLCLALHPPPLPGQPQPDLPAWERPALSLSDLRGAPVLASGPNDRYTRQSRSVLLESESDGRIRWLRFAAGWALDDDPHQPDPMACYRAGANGLVRVGFLEGRALWRDLPALVPAPQGEALRGYQAASVVDWAAGLRRAIVEAHSHQPLLVAGLASDQAKLLRWRVEQFSLPTALLIEPDRAKELHAHVALAEDVHKQLRSLATELVAEILPDPRSKDARARDLVESGPLSASYFSVAERELWALIERIAQDQAEEADKLWHLALSKAARHAWERQLDVLGLSTRAMQAEARLGPRFIGLLRKQLPAAFASATTTLAQGD